MNKITAIDHEEVPAIKLVVVLGEGEEKPKFSSNRAIPIAKMVNGKITNLDDICGEYKICGFSKHREGRCYINSRECINLSTNNIVMFGEIEVREVCPGGINYLMVDNTIIMTSDQWKLYRYSNRDF